MHQTTLFSAFSLLSSLSPVVASSETYQSEAQGHTHNANYIFNAIHSSMRQWGSSLNHNGMSFFLATVPEGTQLYHGTSNPEAIKGMEWLAFEPEHALIFAHPRGRRPPGRQPPPRQGLASVGPPLEEGVSDDQNRGEALVEWDAGKNPHKNGTEPKRPHHGGPGGERPPPPPPHERPPFDEPPHGPPPPHDGPPPPHDGPPPPPPPHGHPHGPPPPHDGPPFDGPHSGPPPPPHHKPAHPPAPPPHHDMPMHHPHGPRPEHPHTVAEPECDGLPPPPHHHKRNRQQPFLAAEAGYLHTYAPKHDLKLLYIDGMSAGKTSNGTLDTQDKLLLNLTWHGAMGGEYERAQGLCNLSSTVWEQKIDGVLRMERGFEIILCEFEKHLEVRDIMAVVEQEGERGPMGSQWQYQKAITNRYYGIGGGRVVVDYESFVSVFDYPDLDIWTNDVESDTAMPRLQNVADAALIQIKDAVTAMVLEGESLKPTTDWQAVADMVVGRYSAPLHHLHTDETMRASKEAYASYLATLLRPFIDHSSRNSSAETARCIAQLVPVMPTPPFAAPPLAHKAIYTVTRHLCTTLLSASDMASLSLSRSLSPTSPPPSHALQLVDSLKDYLQWTTWKQCSDCGDAQICVVPIWPGGTFEQHKNPKCQSEELERGSDGYRGGDEYWGRRGSGPPPPGEGPPGEGGPPGEKPGEGPGGEHGPAREHNIGWKEARGRKHGGKCGMMGKPRPRERIWARFAGVLGGWFGY